MTVFFDTNLLAYAFDGGSPDKQARARQLIVEHASDAVISTQVMVELHAVLTRKLGLDRAAAGEVLDALDFPAVPTDAALVRRAASTATSHDLSIFDALILEAAVVGGCDELWTEDLATGAELRGVRVVNPFSSP